jgi:hypothetical protein
MKHLRIAAFVAIMGLAACQKDTIETVDEPVISNPTDMQIAFGDFVSGSSYTTQGKVQVLKTADNQQFLVFENFQTNAGPDLRIYLAEDRQASNFVEVSDEVKNGNYQVAIPANADLSRQKFVLIWCKQFSVLFGSAELQ